MAKQNRCVAGDGTRRSRHLPVELQEEVLVRLPVKSLTRFESVCKTWRSKFHSRPFIDSYGILRPDDDDSKHSLEFFIAHSRKEELMKMAPGLWDLSLSLEPTDAQQQQHWRSMMYALGPLNNGVYCLTSHTFDKSRDQLNILFGKIALCNPSTRSYKVTNPFPSDLCSLLSDKIASRAHLGFGKVNSSISLEEDYKVVVLVQSHKDLASFIGLVYSLRSGVWKQIVDRKAIELLNTVYSISYSLELRPRRFLEGCWHWIARGRDHSFNVLSFNIADEAFKLIRGPPFNPYHHLKASVFTLRDRLAVIICYSEIIPQCVVVGVDIWMMMEYGIEESWTRIYKCKPDFHGRFMRLLRIEFRPRRDDESCEACIKGLSFSDSNGHVIWCDDVGHEVRGDWESMTNPEGSTCIETLERL